MKSDQQRTLKHIIASAATWQLVELLSFNKRDAIYNRAVNYHVKKELRSRGYENHTR